MNLNINLFFKLMHKTFFYLTQSFFPNSLIVSQLYKKQSLNCCILASANEEMIFSNCKKDFVR